MARRSPKKRQKGVAAQTIASRVAEMKEGILQIESLLQEAGALAGTETRRAEEIRRALGERAARREAEAAEREKMLRERSAAQEETQTELTARIKELENDLARKEELFQSRVSELQDGQAQSQDTRTAVLQAQVKEQQEALRQKEAALRELQESSAARVPVEEQVKKAAELLERRDAEIAELRAKIDELRLFHEGGVNLTEENVVLLEEVAQGAEVEGPPQRPVSAKGKMIGRSMREVVMQPGKSARQETPSDPRRSRWATLLAPVKKGN